MARPVCLSLDGDRVSVRFPYDPIMVDAVKTIPERSWDKSNRRWLVPVEFLDTICETFPQAQVTHDLLRLNQSVAKWVEFSNSVVPRSEQEIQLKAGPLWSHQVAAVQYIEGKHGRCLLADDPGSGKTAVVLSYLNNHPELRPVLIVCPAIAKHHWQRELQKWLGEDACILASQNAKPIETPWAIINYDILAFWLKSIQAWSSKAVVFDESHYLKNNQTTRYHAAYTLAQQAKSVICMTGTPVMNRPGEVFYQVDLASPGMFENLWTYQSAYCDGHKDSLGHWDASGVSNLPFLEHRLRARLMVRREKTQIGDRMPGLLRVTVDMHDLDLREYEKQSIRSGQALRELKSEAAFRRASLEVLSKHDRKEARAAGLSLGGLAGLELAEITALRLAVALAKINDGVDYIRELMESGPVVVFAHHHEVIDRLSASLDNAAVLDGRTPDGTRASILDQFQAGDLPVIVCGIRAAGQAINLWRAHQCVTVELDWNWARHTQAEARLHRIGQTRSVTSHYLVASGTIDVRMMQIIEGKKQLGELTLGEEEEEGLIESLASFVIEN